MSFTVNAIRVLIASPSDLPEERRAAIDAVHEWNAQHSPAESVVLLPVAWETHSVPRSGVRPQAAINEQLVSSADILIGMFWTKLGTSTGVAESGTVEEIDQFVAQGKPALLYFSHRPIDPNKIDLKQHKRLKVFQAATYSNALVGSFTSPEELKATLSRNLLAQVRQMSLAKPPRRRMPKIDEALKLTELIVAHKTHNITPETYNDFREALFGKSRSKGTPSVPAVATDEVGPNGHRVGFTKEGDKVEWLPDDENPGEEWPMILRRNDNAIADAASEFADVIWYDRKLVLLANLKEGSETIDSGIYEGMIKAMKSTEKKYGKKKLRNYYHNDFEWGMLNGKLSALRWVLGDDWDMLDT
ncbi:hypothetical protein QWJ07_30895 [Frankia sp. RB7]|nr:hypothetical protein [Frankia sp. RB7]